MNIKEEMKMNKATLRDWIPDPLFLFRGGVFMGLPFESYEYQDQVRIMAYYYNELHDTLDKRTFGDTDDG